MSIKGWYYLHTNNDLIYKPHPDAACDIRDSDFARHLWPVDPDDREGAWRLLVEAHSLGAKPERIASLAAKWGCDDEDAENYANRIGVTIQRDGNAWCATAPGFENLQESPAGFGETKLEAMGSLARELGMAAGMMWAPTFHDLLKKVAGSENLEEARNG